MAFDQPTRNRLNRFVGEARALLTTEFARQMQSDYGIDPGSGRIDEVDSITHLDDRQRETARILRDTLDHYMAGKSDKKTRTAAIDRIVREQAFTALNRLAALRMMEARGFLVQSIAEGVRSDGFQLYQQLAGVALGETDETYIAYLFSLFDEFAVDLPVLFDRFSPEGRLFPSVRILRQLLALLNDPEIVPLWAEDETIGWIYKEFNTKQERRQMRAASQAPRNSRELAVRNQFFTPRYVVEFLTDNTLGRIWYEMTQGESRLGKECRYLVRRSKEIFLAPGEGAPEQESAENLSQQELLRQTVYIPHRPLKDPREIKMLDPACGSMHFGLYAFDLFETIYDEAWEMGVLGEWAAEYADKATYMRDVPRLIIERNIYGIDIDARAVQIAGLSLWLRAQRSWQAQGLSAGERPVVTRSNVVVAEPMPGDKAELEAFLAGQLDDTSQDRIVAGLMRRVFEAMKLAGEAGSLLKIEEVIADNLALVRDEIASSSNIRQKTFFAQPQQRLLSLDFAPFSDEEFWKETEHSIYGALQRFAEGSAQRGSYRSQLFADDVASGLAFIDVCYHQYDVVLMNPPFGDSSTIAKAYIRAKFPNSHNDLYAAFVDRWTDRLTTGGRLGAITSNTGFFLSTFSNWRENIILSRAPIEVAADLGAGVLDGAVVNTAAYCVELGGNRSPSLFFRLLDSESKDISLRDELYKLEILEDSHSTFAVEIAKVRIIPESALAYWASPRLFEIFAEMPSLGDIASVEMGMSTKNDFRYVRCWWEVRPQDIGFASTWAYYPKGGNSQPFRYDNETVVRVLDDFRELKADLVRKYSYLKGDTGWVLHPEYSYGKSGLTYGRRVRRFTTSPLAADTYFSEGSGAIFPVSDRMRLALMSLLSTNPVRALLGMITSVRKMEAGYIANIPVPELSEVATERLQGLAMRGLKLFLLYDSISELSPRFTFPILDHHSEVLYEASYSAEQTYTEANETAYAVYGLSDQDKELIERELPSVIGISDPDFSRLPRPSEHISSLMSYSLGCSFGRWDIRYCDQNNLDSSLLDPFDPLPVCPPGMLQSADGLPATPGDVPADYPMRISWPGIMVDDDGHPEDIVSCVREALHVIWKGRADDIEAEACGVLGVDSLRDHFGNPNQFFADHLSRYSKSRRAAPIYWPLTTASGSYTLWLYYHRLSDGILYQCVNDFVDPKLAAVQRQLTGLRGRARNRDEERDLERLTDLAVELEAFRKDLLDLARFWRPNLNDGVQITAAPLHALFGHRQWRERLTGTWEQLKTGDYDWAHLAMSIWPSRVVPKCTEDRSLAIAHDIETLLWVEEDGQWRPLDDPETEATRQIEMRQSPERDRLRELLASLAADEGRYLPAMEIGQSLNEGAWDHRPLGLHLYPERAAEAAFEDSTLVFPNLEADDQQLLAKRTKKNQKLLTQRLLDRGSPELADAVGATLANEPVDFATLWAKLAAGQRDAAPLALELWPERVVGKARKDRDLAAQHGLFNYFWYDEPGIGVRQRQNIRREIDHEVERRGGDKL